MALKSIIPTTVTIGNEEPTKIQEVVTPSVEIPSINQGVATPTPSKGVETPSPTKKMKAIVPTVTVTPNPSPTKTIEPTPSPTQEPETVVTPTPSPTQEPETVVTPTPSPTQEPVTPAPSTDDSAPMPSPADPVTPAPSSTTPAPSLTTPETSNSNDGGDDKKKSNKNWLIALGALLLGLLALLLFRKKRSEVTKEKENTKTVSEKTEITTKGANVNESINFNNDSYNIDDFPKNREKIKKIIADAVGSGKKIDLIAMASARGADGKKGDVYNQKLSENRAKATKDAIVEECKKLGIDPSTVIGKDVAIGREGAKLGNSKGIEALKDRGTEMIVGYVTEEERENMIKSRVKLLGISEEDARKEVEAKYKLGDKNIYSNLDFSEIERRKKAGELNEYFAQKDQMLQQMNEQDNNVVKTVDVEREVVYTEKGSISPQQLKENKKNIDKVAYNELDQMHKKQAKLNDLEKDLVKAKSKGQPTTEKIEQNIQNLKNEINTTFEKYYDDVVKKYGTYSTTEPSQRDLLLNGATPRTNSDTTTPNVETAGTKTNITEVTTSNTNNGISNNSGKIANTNDVDATNKTNEKNLEETIKEDNANKNKNKNNKSKAKEKKENTRE